MTGVSSLSLRARLRLALLLGFLLLQLVPYRRPQTGGVEDSPSLPVQLRPWLQERCYDCHSNQARWPWYSYVAPISWWLADEVRRAQAGVNFSRWSGYSPRQQRLAWRRSLERIRQDLMPPASYRWMHPKPLDEQEVEQLEDFIQQQELARPDDLTPTELLAWPSAPSVQHLSGVITQPLVLRQSLILVDGDLDIENGVEGQGAVLVTGRLTLKLPPSGRDLALFSLKTPESSSRSGHFCMIVPGIRQLRLEYCRDDGELGEQLERQMVVRQSISGGEFVLWDPEFQRVERASSPEAALLGVERLLSADPAMSLSRWRRRFRKAWRKRLEQMSQGLEIEPAVLELDINPRRSSRAEPAAGS